MKTAQSGGGVGLYEQTRLVFPLVGAENGGDGAGGREEGRGPRGADKGLLHRQVSNIVHKDATCECGARVS